MALLQTGRRQSDAQAGLQCSQGQRACGLGRLKGQHVRVLWTGQGHAAVCCQGC